MRATGSRSAKYEHCAGHKHCAEHNHCWHIGQGFALMGPDGKPSRVGAQRLCCHCGGLAYRYSGVEELGHGPYVSYEGTGHIQPKLVVPKIQLPS